VAAAALTGALYKSMSGVRVWPVRAAGADLGCSAVQHR
jgi:hypothetical protein